jgi:hypothetical protein
VSKEASVAEKELTELSDRELEKAIQQVGKDRAALNERGRALAAEADRRAVARRVEQYTEAEREALRQMVKTEGIPSAEAMGEPS